MADLKSDRLTVATPAGGTVALKLRISRRAQRVSLRIDANGADATLVVPQGVPIDHAARFARMHATWLTRRLSSPAPRVLFEDGQVIPILGRDCVIRHHADAQGGVWLERGAGDEASDEVDALCVSGEGAHLGRRVTDWLKEQARDYARRQSRDYAARLNRRVTRVTVRDTTSRWGSCAASGALSFSWRLIFAPPRVFDYVCAHEAAHLAEMNHAPAFWRLVEELFGDWRPQRRWLKEQGAQLHRYG